MKMLLSLDDLTFSSGPNGEQSMLVLGEGKKPTTDHLVKLGMEAKLPAKFIEGVIEQTIASLDRWRVLSREYGVSKTNIELISKLINNRK